MRDLRARFGAVLALAMLPLLVFSIWQSYYDYKRDSEARYAALVLSARQSATEVLNTLERAKSVLRTMETTLARDGNCSETLEKLAAEFTGFNQLYVARPDGTYLCSTDPVIERAQSFRAAGNFTQEKPFMVMKRDALTAKGSTNAVIRLVYGGFTEDVLSRIFIADLAPHQLALDGNPLIGNVADTQISILNARAQVLAGTDSQTLKVRQEWIDRALIEGEYAGRLIRDEKDSRNFIILPTNSENLFIAFSQPYQSLLSWNFVNPLSSAIVPILAWIFGFLAIWIATDQLILTHLRRMRTGVVKFARGDMNERIGELNNPPSSIRDLRKTLDLMADRISTREEELEDSLDEKDTLLREIHHRVKNNLQIIISLLNMQERKLTDAQGLEAVRETRSRINAIALIHRGLYESEDLRYIPMDVFLQRLTRELGIALGTDQQGISIKSESNCMPLEADTAIPVALFIVEAMTNSVKHAVNNGGEINVILHQSGDDIRATVRDSGSGFDFSASPKGTGTKLIQGFARQLSGFITNEMTEEGHDISLAFSYRPYSNPV